MSLSLRLIWLPQNTFCWFFLSRTLVDCCLHIWQMLMLFRQCIIAIAWISKLSLLGYNHLVVNITDMSLRLVYQFVFDSRPRLLAAFFIFLKFYMNQKLVRISSMSVCLSVTSDLFENSQSYDYGIWREHMDYESLNMQRVTLFYFVFKGDSPYM